MKKISDYMTIKEASEYLGVSKKTLRSWDKKNKVSVIRNPMSGYRMYERESLDKVLESLTTKLGE